MSNNFLNLENTALSKNSADCLLNLLQLNLLGANASANNSNINSGLQYVGDRGGIGGGGNGGTVLTKEQQQAIFYQSRGVGGGGGGGGGAQQQQKSSSGRAITNTGNLCNNFGQAQDIFSQSILNCGGGSGKLNNEPGEYKSNLRGGCGQDGNMGSQAKPFRNGGDGKYLPFFFNMVKELFNLFCLFESFGFL